MKCHFTPTGIAKIKKKIISKFWWECGEIGILLHCQWDCKMVIHCEKLEVPQNINKDLPYDLATPFLGICSRVLKT